MMEERITYILRPEHLSYEHRMHISEGMKRMYSSKGGKRTEEEKKRISEGMKRCWKEWKENWKEEGWI